MLTWHNYRGPVAKLATAIPGFDLIAYGGLPEGRSTLLSGTSGSAKTVFACQFLAEGIRRNEPGVFVTFEESPEAIRKNMEGFNWDIPSWEKANQWAFVDVSPHPGQETVISGSYDLNALLVRIENATRKVRARRMSLDSLGGVFAQLGDSNIVRNELFRIVCALKELGVTSIITAERTDEYGQVSRYGIEEFVTDNVIILRNGLEQEKRRRTIEILKFRGAAHQKGEYPFTVSPNQGRRRHSPVGHRAETEIDGRAYPFGRAGAGSHVWRRLLPRFHHLALRSDRYRQDAGDDDVHCRRRPGRRALLVVRV